jgi:DNA-directed RNA polymerase subunit RPC12/RpoP
MNPPTPKLPARRPDPQYVGFECHVCQTRMYAPPDLVGRSAKCPDCGAKTKIPPPAAAPAKKQPAALEGEQYELWDVDAAPRPSELLAAQPQYVAIQCRSCQTLFYATLDQVGQELPCPDCGTRHVVPSPPTPAKTKHVMVAGSEIYELDAAAAPGERPAVIVPPRRPMLYEEEDAERARVQAARDARRGKRAAQRYDARGRPLMPRWPLLRGVASFLFASGTRVRWFGLSLGLVIGGAVFVDAIHTWLTWEPRQMGYQGGMMAMAGLAEMLIGSVLALVWLAAASSMIVVVVSESAEGNEQVHGWPPVNFIESLSDVLYVLIAGMVAAGPGFAIGRFAAEAAWQQALWTGGSFLLLFPLVFLSQMAAASPWSIVSGQVIGAIVRRPFSWLLFCFESALLGAVSAAAIFYTAPIHFLVPVLLAPLYVAAILLYARLIGRLGWVLAEARPATNP